MKERFLSEDHGCQHTAQAPHIEAVVIHLNTEYSGRANDEERGEKMTETLLAEICYKVYLFTLQYKAP